MSRRLAVLAVYLAALLQGLTLVIFPAESAVLKGLYGLSDTQYGTIFLPQMVMAVGSALAGGTLARRWGLKRLLLLSLLANTLSQICLFGASLVPVAHAYIPILCGTGFLGLGFGLSAAPQNGYPGVLFPEHRDVALVASHATVGLGLALGPLPAGWLGIGPEWRLYPLTLALVGGSLLIASLRAVLPDTPHPTPHPHSPRIASPNTLWSSRQFLLFAVIALLYGWQEGIFQNWGILLLKEEKGIAPATAALALTTFWMTATAGRITATFLLLRIRAIALWQILPAPIALSFLLIPRVTTPFAGIALFALAGLGCSAFFPLTMALGTRASGGREAQAASLLIVMLVTGNSGGTFLYGALRGHFSLGGLYQISAVLPLVVLGLMAVRSKG
jgi:fucose permease